MKYIFITVSFVLALSGEATAQRFSKEFFTVHFLDESITFMASIDYTTKRHFTRDFLLSNALSFAKVMPKTNRIVVYTFMVAFEFGQGRVDLLDILAGALGVEFNFAIRRYLFNRKEKK